MEQPVAVAQPSSGAVAVQHQPPALELTVAEMKRRKEMITECMREVMIEEQHYGVIPGTDGKKSLLKPGAEMLGLMFRLHPHFDVRERELERGHREYTVTCTLTSIDGTVVATALGLCSTMESKYRWRNKQRTCPSCGSESVFKSKNGGDGFFCWAKKGGCGKNFRGDDRSITAQPLGKVENADIADTFNTVLKMAVKRAHVGAMLLATGASDMFEQEENAPKDVHPDDDAGASAEEVKELAAECARLATALDRDRDSIADLLKGSGGTAPKKAWTELSLVDLAKAKSILAAEVALVGGKPKGGK